jgi:hypothetical protein
MEEFRKTEGNFVPIISRNILTQSLNFEFIPFSNKKRGKQKEPSQEADGFDNDDELVQKKKSRISKKDLQVES